MATTWSQHKKHVQLTTIRRRTAALGGVHVEGVGGGRLCPPLSPPELAVVRGEPTLRLRDERSVLDWGMMMMMMMMRGRTICCGLVEELGLYPPLCGRVILQKPSPKSPPQ
jgi:hypothetical protein